MRTTAIYAEILIIGLQAGVWLALLVASIFEINIASIQHLQDWQATLILPVVAVTYVLGIMVDRLADNFFGMIISVRDKYIEEAAEKLAKKEEAAEKLAKKEEDTEKRVKKLLIRFFRMIINVRDKDIEEAAKNKKQNGERPPFGEQRLYVLIRSDTIAKFLDYQRGRLRIARATAFNLFFITLTGIPFLLIRTDFPNNQIVIFALLGIALSFLVWYIALRIESAQSRNLENAYNILKENPKT